MGFFKRLRIIVVILITLVGLTVLFLGCGKKKTAEKSKTEEQKAVAYWTCSMHPEVKSDKPGKCPTCGMALTPVYKSN